MKASRRLAVGFVICFGLLGLTLPEDGVDGWVTAGDAAAARGSHGQALSLFEGTVQRGGQGGALLLRIGQVHLAKHRFSDAESWLLLARADCAAAQAAPAWTRLPASICVPQANLALGELFRQTARPTQARDVLLSSLAGGEQAAALPLALVDLRAGELDQARGLLTGLAARGDGQASLLLGLLLLASDPEGARAPLTAAAQGADLEAAAAARQVLSSVPALAGESDPAFRALLAGRAALRAGQPYVAFADFGLALRANPAYADALALQGYVLQLLGEPSAAIASADGALALDPVSSQGNWVRGLALRAQGQTGAAVANLEAAIGADPGNPVILMDLGDTYALLRNYPQAQADLEAATRADPSSPIPWLRLARFHLESLLGVDTGLAAAKRAVGLAPENGEARELLGWGLYLTGQQAEALQELTRSVVLAPKSASAHYHLGLVAEQAGDEETARRELQRAVDLDTTGQVEPRAARALAGIR